MWKKNLTVLTKAARSYEILFFLGRKKNKLERENITKLTSLLLPPSLSLLLLFFYEIKIFEGIS